MIESNKSISQLGKRIDEACDYRIASFNVNGLRSIVDQYKVTRNWSIDQWLDSFDADVICFQETKINDVSRITPTLANPHRYHAYYAFHQKNHLLEASKGGIGYAGVVTFVRKSSSPSLGPIAYEEGFTGIFCDGSAAMTVGSRDSFSSDFSTKELQQFDAEGRVIITDHQDFIVINVYCPNNSGGDIRQKYRTKFYLALWKRYYEIVRSVQPVGKPVILVGDINIAYHPRDHADYASPYAELCRRYGEHIVEQRIADYARNPGHDTIVTIPMEEAIKSHQQVMAKVMADDSTAQSERDPIDRCIHLFFEDSPMRLWLYRELNAMNSELTGGDNCNLRDSFRIFSPSSMNCYTCWDMQSSSRSINYGSRIDMAFIASAVEYGMQGISTSVDESNLPRSVTILSSKLLTDIMGSDHCPIMIEIRVHNPTSIVCSSPVVPRNTKSFINQSKISSFFTKKSAGEEVCEGRETGKSLNKHQLDDFTTSSDIDSLSTVSSKKRNLDDFFKKV